MGGGGDAAVVAAGYEKLIRGFAARRMPGVDLDARPDLYDEMRRVVEAAVAKFQPGRANLTTWVYKALLWSKTIQIRTAERRKAREAHYEGLRHRRHADRTPDADRVALAADVAAAVAALPEPWRRVAEAWLAAGCSQVDAAGPLGITGNGVNWHMKSIKPLLRDLLRDYAGGEHADD